MIRQAKYKIRQWLPRSVRQYLHRVALFLGDEFKASSEQFGGEAFPSINATFLYLKEWGFAPVYVIDVGAFRGEWTRALKQIFPDASVFMIEAQDNARPALDTVCSYYSGVSYEIALLGATDGTPVQFFEMLTGSSVFEEQSQVPRKQITTTTKTLDSLVGKRANRIDLLKLDVQGYELEVLKGAMQSLSNCEFVLLESSLIPINSGCPLIAEVIAFMNTKGFHLLDFCSQIRRKDGALWQTDLIFISKTSPFLPRPQLTEANW